MTKIYLCGGIKKTKDDHKIVWSKTDKEIIMTVMPEAEFLDPQRNPERDDPMAGFGMDLNDIREADIILVDMRQKRGIGIGSEMVIAKNMRKPVVSLVPEDSHYNRSIENTDGKFIENWVHPFVFGLSDALASDVEGVAKKAKELLANPDAVKDASIVDEAIEYYQKKRGSK